jgi:hypothetical protein
MDLERYKIIVMPFDAPLDFLQTVLLHILSIDKLLLLKNKCQRKFLNSGRTSGIHLCNLRPPIIFKKNQCLRGDC